MGLFDKISSAFKPAEKQITVSNGGTTVSGSEGGSHLSGKITSGIQKGTQNSTPGTNIGSVFKQNSSIATQPGKVLNPNTTPGSANTANVPDNPFGAGLTKGRSSTSKVNGVGGNTNGSTGTKFEYSRPSDKLSDRAHQNGLRAGEDYNNISADKKAYIDTYYNTLDRAEITKPFLELEGLIRDKDYSSDKFDTKYQQLMDYIDEELRAERKANGATSSQYRALEQVKQDVLRLGAQYAVDKQYDQNQKASGQLDESINSIFAGIMNSTDYDATVNAGRQAVSQDSAAKKWFDSNMANASETQRNLMYYTYQKEGLAGVKEMFNDYMGNTLNSVSAGREFISDIVNNPDASGRLWEATKSSWNQVLGGIFRKGEDGSYVSSIKQLFSDTESDPTNRELIAGYTANDAIDTSLREELGTIADSPEFEQIGNEGFSMMRAYGVNDDWYKDAAKNATDFQKQFLGYMYAATDGDTAAVQAVWESIKESEEAIWSAVHGANTLPYGREAIEGDIYRRYTDLSGAKAPSWLAGHEGQTMANLLWDAASTVIGQVPQLAGNLAGMALMFVPGGQAIAPIAARVLGAGAMTVGAYGNTYKETRDEGYDKTKSSVYAGADAAMEFISDYLFSGIGPVKGLLNNKMTSKVVANIATPIARAFTKLGINMLSEGGQEYFQAINEPLMRNVLLGESNDFSLYTEEAKYNFFMGAFSAAILGSLDADTNLMRQVRENIQNKDVGQALNAQKSTEKLIDRVLNTDPDSIDPSKKKAFEEALESAKKMDSGEHAKNDINVGELLRNAAEAGVDLQSGFLDNPDTVSYTKEQLSVDDLRAGAVSRLATLGGNTEMAEDIAKMAKGMTVSEESQSAIQKDAKATQVLDELQSELNLEENNALTIAARSSQVDGAFAKITAAVQANNPDKTILSPNAQFIKEQGVGLAEAQRIGAVFDKVMDGHQITKDEAKLVNVRNKGIQGALLARLDIDLLETASTDAVMTALNEKAAQVARVKDMQAGVKQATQARVSGQSGATPASKATQNARQRRRGEKNGTKGTSVQAQAGTEAAAEGQAADLGGSPAVGAAGAGSTSAGGPGSVRTGDGSSQVGLHASGSRTEPRSLKEVREWYNAIPVEKLNEEQKALHQALTRNKAGAVVFIRKGNSFTTWLEEDGVYCIAIRVNSYFSIDQFGDHEIGHLWLKSLSERDKKSFLFLVRQAFGEDFNKAFAQVREKYTTTGNIDGSPAFEEDVNDNLIIEEMYCTARGNEDFSHAKNEKVLRFDFSKYHDAMLEIEKIANLEDMAKGNMNNPQVRQNYENGNFNHTFYERQGYLDEDFAPDVTPDSKKASNQKKPTIPAKKKSSNPTLGSAEDRAQYVQDQLSPDGMNLAEAIDGGSIFHGGVFGVPFDVQKNSDGTYSVFFKDPVGDSAGDLVVKGIGQGKFKSLDEAFAAAYDACYAYDQAYKNSNQDLGVAEKALADSLSGKKTTTEKRTEAKQTLDKLAGKKEKSAEKPKTKTEKATETKAEKATEAKAEKPKKSKGKEATIPSKSEADELKELYAQRKAAQQRKFDEGKLKKTQEQLDRKLAKLDAELQGQLEELSWFDEPLNKNPDKLTVTPEAIARAENLSEDVRNDLISELAGLQAELKADRSMAENEGYIKRVQAWFDKANAALNEANKPKVSALQELRSRAEQLVANPELANDPEFVRRNEELLALATAEMAERAANAQVDAEQLAEEASQETQPEAQQEKTEPSFDYDAELKKLDDWREARRKSQYAKMEKNPEKTDASLNAKLKDIEDEYAYKKQALAAKARRNGDLRFSVDPADETRYAIGPDMGTEENDEQLHYSGAPERGSDVSGRGRLQDVARGQAGAQGVSAYDGRAARSVMELSLRRCEKVGIRPSQILQERDWTPQQRAVAEQLYDAGFQGVVLFRRSAANKTPWVGQSWFEKGLPPTVAICVNGSRSAEKVATHESWHLWLRSLKGDKSHGKHLDFVNFILGEAFADDPEEFQRLRQMYHRAKDADFREIETARGRAFGWGDNEIGRNIEADIAEEIFCDLVSGQIYDDERLDDILDLVDESGVLALAQGDYDDPGAGTLIRAGYLDSEYAAEQKHDTTKAMLMRLRNSMMDDDGPLFAIAPDEDFDAEELMDRRDEMRSGYNEAQIWQDSSLNEEDTADTDSAQPSADDDYDAKMNALMAEMDAHPERMEEIIAQMTALAEERSASNTRALEERSTKSKPKKTEAKKTEPAKAETKTEPKKPVIPAKAEAKAEPAKAETKTEPKKAEKPAAAKAFQPKSEKAKPAPVNEAAPELKKPEMHRGQNPVDVKGLSKKKAIDKVTRAKSDYEAWYAQEKGKLDQQYDSKKLDDAKYAKEITKLTERRNKDVGRYNDQLKRLEAVEEVVKEKPTVIKDKETTYTPKVGEWWRRIKNGTNIQIRRLRSDRNTYDVSFTDSKGNQVVYEAVSPSMLEKALGEGLRKKADAKAMLSPAYESAASSLGEWQSVDYAKRAEEVKPGKPKPDKTLDNYGRKISYQMETRMANSTVRDQAGRLMSVYRLGPANGTQNANPNARYTLWAERPATMNLMRGLNGVEAYDQAGKKVGANIEKWLQELEEHPKMSEGNKNAIRAKIAATEKANRKYTTHVTRLDPWRPGYSNPERADVIGNKTLLEGYVDIRNPLVIDAKGKGMAFVRDTIQDFLSDPANLAGQVDVDGNALGEHDGIKFINVTVTDDNKSLGGGQLDRDTLYVTFRANQGKSTYNTAPTDSELMQYAIDPDTETGYPEGSWQNAVLQVLQDKDYDHAVESLTMYLAQYLQTGVVPEIDNEQTRKIFQPRITPAEHAYLNERARELIDRYHAFKPGENPARQVFMPKERADGNVRQTYRTAAESRNTPDWGVDFLMREALTSDDAVYQRITDKSAIAAANRDMRSKGYNQMLAEWRAKADSDAAYKIDKYDIAKAVSLYSEAFSAGNAEDAMAIIAEIAEVETTSAQIVQAARLIKHMPPSYQLYYLRRVVNRLNNQYRKRIDSGRMSEIKINKDLAKAVLNAKNQEELDKAMQALIEDVANNVPVTGWDQWNAWRYLSMLGNPKTHIRNIFGNALFVPAKFSKDLIAAGLEGMFIKNRLERRTSLKGVVGRNSEYRDFAKQDYEGIKQELQSGGKYNMTNEIMNARTIFKWSKGLEFLRKFNGDALEAEDGAFLRFHYVNALTNFLTTQGMSVKDLQTTPEGRKIMNAARLYAFNEAQKATYRDASQVAAALNQLKQKSGPMGLLFEGVFPFAKTPVNILKRGVEYSPIGLLDSLSRGLVQLKNGTITANELIDRIASGLTGTGIAALGWWLSSLGLLRGGGDDDDKQNDFDKLQGYQDYSINLGGINYTIDWAAPVALPLFVGGEIFNQLREGGELTLADGLNALLVIAEPLTQLSMLSGINDLLTSTKYDEHPLSSAIETMASSYLTQALPTLVAQLSRSLTPDRRTTFVDKNSDVPQPIQRWWQTNVMGKTPLNAQRTEYIDAWGRKDTTASFAMRLFENMVSPGYINRVNTTPVDEELQKLADKVGTGVLMTTPERKIEYNNETHYLTAAQYQTYAKTRGDAAMEMLTDLFNSEGYQNSMSDDEKAYAVDAIKDYANAIGKQAVFDDYETNDDNWAEKCDGDPTRITNMAMLRAQAHELGVKTNSTAFHTVILNASYLTPVDQAYAIAQTLDLGNDAYVYETGKSSIKYAIDSDDKDLIEEHYRQIFPAYYLPATETEQWINATPEQRAKLLSQVRADAKADAKAWLATIKAAQGAPLYVKK